jgi:translation elongation factor EF-Ts
MIEGKLKSFLEENCLYNMNYILAGDNGETVILLNYFYFYIFIK